MGKIKIHEIAKELELNSKEVIQRANELGINVTSHLSAVEEDVAQKIRDSFGKKQEKGKTNKEEKVPKKEEQSKTNKEEKKQEKAAKKGNTPVIIRREVILADEEKEHNRLDEIN